MTDEDIRTINRALMYLEDDDEFAAEWREKARAALHRLFRYQCKLEQEVERLREENEDLNREFTSPMGREALAQENERLRTESDADLAAGEIERLRKFETLWNDRKQMVDAEVERLTQQRNFFRGKEAEALAEVERLKDERQEIENYLRAEVERLREECEIGARRNRTMEETIERLRAKVSAMQTMALSTGHYTADQETLVDEVERLKKQWEESSRFAFQQENERLRERLIDEGDRAAYEHRHNQQVDEIQRLNAEVERLRKRCPCIDGCDNPGCRPKPSPSTGRP